MLEFFELYQIKPTFTPNADEVRQAYLKIQREWHPDFFASEPEKYNEALHKSAMNNEAFKALKDIYSSTEYILREHGLLAEGEKNVLAPEFLAEMLDLNDLIADAAFGDAESGKQASEILMALEAKNDAAMRDEALKLENPAMWNQNSLANMKAIFQQYRYLSRLRRNLSAT